jgi:inosine triphosphate pyrophosphatase
MTSAAALRRSFVFVTGNANKLRELQQILGPDVESVKLDVAELQGSPDFIVAEKSKLAAKTLNRTVLVEDVSLNLHALGGLPGPYIKYFVEQLGPHGLIKLLAAFDDKRATAVCSFALCAPNEEPTLFVGTCDGVIVAEPRVAPGNLHPFGFDPIFQPEGFTQTYAELEPAVKNRISHRGRGLAKLKSFFDDNLQTQA